MKKNKLILFLLLCSLCSFSQENIDELLVAGVNDTKQFLGSYIKPANSGLAYAINTGWYNNASANKMFGFEISLIGGATFISDEKKSFQLNVANYQNIRFPDNSFTKNVATALGENNPSQSVIITYSDPAFGNQEVVLNLPTGIGSTSLNIIPNAFVQAGFSPLKGTQLKVRFFPKVNVEDANLSLYGVGIQQDFTSILPASQLLPIKISGLVAYTHLNGDYNFTDNGFVQGLNQKIESETKTFLYELIVGTKLKLINFYGSFSYVDGKSSTDLIGTYTVRDLNNTSLSLTDPINIRSNTSGFQATIGANLKLGFFGLNASYTKSDFSNASLAVNFML